MIQNLTVVNIIRAVGDVFFPGQGARIGMTRDGFAVAGYGDAMVNQTSATVSSQRRFEDEIHASIEAAMFFEDFMVNDIVSAVVDAVYCSYPGDSIPNEQKVRDVITTGIRDACLEGADSEELIDVVLTALQQL